MAIKKGDFVEIEYTGRLKEEDVVFDTTDEKTAKESDIYQENTHYRPIIVCVGEKHVLQGIDDSLVGKDIGSFNIVVDPDNGYGRKNPKYLRLVPTHVFKKQNIMPQVGLQVNMDGIIGVIKTVSGGRVIVDFNHPLSGKDLKYDIKVNKIITDDIEKIKALIYLINPSEKVKVELKEGKAKLSCKKGFTEEFKKKLKEDASKLVSSVKDIEFVKEEEKEKPKETEEKPKEQASEVKKEEK